ncbi:MAG: hypothetical protein NWE95_11360 [Candidatus Bathyarchaeota archaeon]|nr:hypothetical protein [Candidatus Bathyarchaeota archaeon]
MTTQQKLEFTRPLLILGNLTLLGWLFLAFLSVYIFNEIYGYLYLLLLTITIYGILRRLGCNSCYMCKTCTSGFGRLAGVFFGKGFVKKESAGNRRGMIAFVYFLLFPLPTTVLALTIWNAFSFTVLAVFACLLTVAFYSLTTWLNH